MSSEHIEVEVFRYDPESDIEPRYETFKVPKTTGMTVLEALKFIYDNQAPIAFRYSCRHSLCGTCGVMVNGTPSLACMTKLQPKVKIEPLTGFPIIRDLVVDFDNCYIRRLKTRPFLETKGNTELRQDLITTEVVAEYKQFIDCIHCYLCLAACPLTKRYGYKFSGPALLIDLTMQSRDPRDKGDRLGVAVAEGVLLCDQCGKCVEVCPLKLPVDRIIYKYFQDMDKKLI